MRIIAEQSLPTRLGRLIEFIDAATKLVSDDMSAYVTYEEEGRRLRVCSSKDLPSEIDDDPFGE